MAGIYVELLEDTGRDGEILHLEGSSFLVGRAAHCDVLVDAEVVSQAHASLLLKGKRWVVRDLDSKAGTLLNDEMIHTAALSPLDEIRLGVAGPRLRVVTLDPPPPPRKEEEIPLAVPLAVPLPETPPSKPPPPPPPPPPVPRRGFPPVLALLGLAFAASLGMGLLGTNFPYEPAVAPILWCMAAIRYLAPDFIPDPEVQLWVFRGLLAAYGLFAGFLLQHPFRRVVYLLALAGVHLLAALAGGQV